MSSSTVLVVGRGAAAVGAAWRLHSRCQDFHVVAESGGATSFTSGALSWPDSTRLARSEDVVRCLRDMKLLAPSTSAGPARVISSAGAIFPVAGVLIGVLDLAPLAGGRIGVVSPPASRRGTSIQMAGWLRGLRADPWVISTGTRFEMIELDEVQETTARDSTGWLAPESTAWRKLADVITGAGVPWDAVLVGPWLGRTLTPELWSSFPCPLGECLSPPEGPMGQRVDRALHRWLERQARGLESGRVTRCKVASEPSNTGIDVEWLSAVGAPGRRRHRAVILAIGSTLGGGVRFDALEAGAEAGWRALPSVDVDLPDRGAVGRADLGGWDPVRDVRSWLTLEESLVREGSGPVQWAGEILGGDSASLGGAIASGIRAADAVTDWQAETERGGD